MIDFYDRSGEPIDFDKWALLIEDGRYAVLKQTRVGDVGISTVWIGTNMGPADEPLIFETMTFGTEEECYRYTTEQEALAHHAELVAQFSLLAAIE